MAAIIECIRAFNSSPSCLMFLVAYTAFTPGSVKLHGNEYTDPSL